MIRLLRGIAAKLGGRNGREDPDPSPADPLEFAGAAHTDAGLCRPVNEDTLTWVHPEDERVLLSHGALALVLDGMGGTSGGATASQMAAEVIRERYYKSRHAPGKALVNALRAANKAIYRKASSDAMLNGMGTTCVAVALCNCQVWAAWAGDARLYLARGDSFYQLSEDHTVVTELVRRGWITNDEARVHDSRHVLTRALGTRPAIDVGTFHQPMLLRPGDRFLLCSDGVYGLLEDHEMEDILKRCTPAEAVSALIDNANERGGYDNASALVVEVARKHTEITAQPSLSVETRG